MDLNGKNVPVPAVADFIAISEEIAALAAARIPLESHLIAAGRQMRGKTGELAERIGRRLSAGENLAAAMDAECGSLPASYRAVVEAGIEGGQLGSAMESLVRSTGRMVQLRRISGAAVLYPLLILIVACWLFALLVTKVVPGFEWLGQYQFGPLLWLSQWPYASLVIAGIFPAVVTLVVALWWWRTGRLSAAGWSRWGPLGWLPGTRAIRRWGEAAAFADLLELLVARGVPLERSLKLAGEANCDSRLRAAALRLADQVGSGSALPAAGSDNETGPLVNGLPLLIRLALRHSTDRGLLAGGLRQASLVYHERALRAAEWYAEFVPILLTVAIGGTITAAFALFLFWPYASALHELSGYEWR